MTGFKSRNVAYAALAVLLSQAGLVACAAPEASTLGTSRGKVKAAKADSTKNSSGGTDGDDDDSGDDDDDVAAPAGRATEARPSAVAPRAAAPTLSVSFLASKKITYNGATVGRVCSDRGADFQNATFIDATSMTLVSVDYPDKVLARIDGAAFQAIKQSVLTTGDMVLPVDVANLPNQPYEFAMVMGGDGRFASPAQCGVSLKPGSTKERDVEEFPNNNTMIFGGKIGGSGCGVVGYIMAYFDQAKQAVVAQATSQLLLAADDEGRAGFPSNNTNPACDWHDSPLVLDLGSRGVSLGAPVASVFDVDGDGALDDSPWVVSEETPFLVRDGNGNGVVDGVDELFGNRTRGPAGERTSRNGFEALGLWDDNGDGVIDVHDTVWSSLRLWFDRNHDGRTDPGELVSLGERGVRSIAVSFVPVKETLTAVGHVQGSIRQRGGATMTDGRVVNVVDVWFDRKPY